MTAKFHFINHACLCWKKTIPLSSSTRIWTIIRKDSPPKTLRLIIFSSATVTSTIWAVPLKSPKNCDATIISTAEICGLAQDAGCKAHAMHLGGTFKFPFGKVRLTLAFHGSGVPGGHACGIVIDFYGTKLYFAGDTALFSDMQLLPKLDAFEYAVLPIGGNFTMDPNDALIACKLLQAKYVIPVHYNTWPPIAQDVEAFKAAVEDETDSKVLIVKPGNTIDID